MKIPERAPEQLTIDNAFFGLLAKSSQNEEFLSVSERIQREYLPWEKIKYLKVPEGLSNKDVWAITKFNRHAGSQIVFFGRYQFRYSITPSIQMALHEFDMQYGGRLGTSNPLQQTDRQQYLISSIMEEAIASSQIEGAVTTRVFAKEMLRRNQTPKNKSERMIINNFKTIQFIREIIQQTLTAERLIEVQKSMTNKTLGNPEDEGRFRDNDEVRVIDVIDGELMHQPPPAAILSDLITALCNFFNQENEKSFVHPIVKASIIHFMIGYIHPFVDGNGRTARALFYWYLLKRGYWLTEYLSISSIILKTRVQYANAFLYTETDENDLTYFIHYKVKTLKLAYASLQAYIQRKVQEKKTASQFLTIGGINERQAQVLQDLIDEPEKILSVTELETKFNVSNQTARNDLRGLERLGLLRSSMINKKKRVFSKSVNFDRELESLKKR